MYGPHDYGWVRSEMHCQPKDEIGAGISGTVYRAVHPTTGQEVAIKKMDRAPLARDASALNSFQREVDMFSRLHHPNIIRLLGVQMEPACHLLIMEVAECELAEELQAGPMAEAECRFYFRQIVRAVGYCHTQGICHRDLKLENVLLMPDNVTVKVTDFGMGKNYLMHSGCKTHVVGSFAYMSPEVIAGRGEYQPSPADIWSLGVMLYAMSICQFPFGCVDPADTTTKPLEKEQRIRQKILDADSITSSPNFFGDPAAPGCISAPLQDLIRKILVVDPCRRATIDAILSHPWLVDTTGEEEYAASQHMPMGSPPMQVDLDALAAMEARATAAASAGCPGGAAAPGPGLPMPSPPVGDSARVAYGVGLSLGGQPSVEMMDVADSVAADQMVSGGWVAPQYNWDEAPAFQPQGSVDSFDFDAGHQDDFFEDSDLAF